MPAGSGPDRRSDSDGQVGTPRHETVVEAMAREGAALDGIPGQDVAYEDALADQSASRPRP
jgi:hypothetical protein